MARGPLIKKLLYSSWFLAAIPATIIFLLLPPIGSQYKIEIKDGLKNDGTFIYSDLNTDSISELIVPVKSGPYFSLMIRNNDFLVYDQWNFKDSIAPSISEVFTGNFDHDKFSEIYVFTYKGDSLFLNVNEILQPSGTRMDRVFITRIGYAKGQVAATLRPAGFFDTDRDGHDELYFIISSYFRLGTRRLFSFNLANKKLNSSQQLGSVCIEPVMNDVDGDNHPEIFGTSSASGNYARTMPFSDSSSWLMVFDDKLRFEFPPVEFPGFANALYTFPYKNEKFRGYVLYHMVNGADTTVPRSRLLIYSNMGKLVRSRLLESHRYPNFDQVFIIKSLPSDRIYLLADRFLELNDKLEVIRSVALPFAKPVSPYQIDINGDGTDEFLLYSESEKKIVLYSSELKILTELAFPAEDVNWKISPYFSSNHKYKLFVSTGKEAYFFKYRRNDLFFWGRLLYPAIYFSLFFFIVIIKNIGNYQQKAKEDLNNRLINLQLQGIKSQLDPHFTFNTLNSIASLIYLEDRHTAYDYMRKFTQLLRCMLNDAEKIYRNLGDELEFVTTYLELEKLRFGDKFNFEIDVSEDVSKREQVPKLVLQTFAENAVKHGIIPSVSGGLIKISVIKEKDYLKMTIEDNGVGRIRAAGQSNSTGKGLKLTREFYEILNQINKRPITYQITDLYDSSSEPAGTRVEVWVPVDDFSDYIRS